MTGAGRDLGYSIAEAIAEGSTNGNATVAILDLDFWTARALFLRRGADLGLLCFR